MNSQPASLACGCAAGCYCVSEATHTKSRHMCDHAAAAAAAVCVCVVLLLLSRFDCAPAALSASLSVYADGSVLVNHGGIEMGQGLATKV